MTATGKPKKKRSGGAPVRPCVCGCGVDARSFSFVLTGKRVDRDGVDLLTPLTQGIEAQRRRELLKQIAEEKCEARVACCHVHPDDMYWTKKCRLKLKPNISPRVSLMPLTKTPDKRGSALRATKHCLECFGATVELSPQREHFHDDSARRSMGPDSSPEVAGCAHTKSSRPAETPLSRGTVRRPARRRKTHTPTSVAMHEILGKESVARQIDFEEQPARTVRSCTEQLEKMAEELDRTRHALKLAHEANGKKQAEINSLQDRLTSTSEKLRDARALFACRNGGHLTFDRLMKDKKLRKGCNALTGWKTPELFKSFWEWVNGGKKCWSDHTALYHESKTGSPAAATRTDLRKLKMDDAFFMFWLIAKQGIDRAAAGYLFGIDPPSVGRYFISITSILEDFINRQFPVMSDEDIYLTQDKKWAAQMGQPVHSIIDCTEVFTRGCSSGTAHAAMYSEYKGHNTAKFLTGIAANGMVDYISEAITGSTTDKKMCMDHGHLEWMKRVPTYVRTRDNKPAIKLVLADKGFTNVVVDYLRHDIKLATPTHKFRGVAFNDADVKLSRENSNLRVHVERANALAKRFKYLTQPVDITRADLFGREFRVIYTIAVNFSVSLCHDSLESCRTKCKEF